MRRTIDQDYTGPNKAEILKKYDALAEGFKANIAPMLVRRGYAVVLKSGYTDKDVRDAFMKLDADFEALIKATQ